MTSARTKLVAYWITTVFGPASFVIGGILFLSGAEQPLGQLVELGYPPYVLDILGVWKILGAIAVVVPGLPLVKEWAYAGFFFELTGAAASRALAGDDVGEVATPLFFLALVIASWALRPPSRRLAVEGGRTHGAG